MASSELLLIRHGETAWNATGRIQGQIDVPLSPTGIWQAGRLAQHVGELAPPLRPAAVVASDLARAWFTAHPMAAHLGVPVQAEPRVRERHFGVFEGLTLDEVAASWPAEFAAWRSRDENWAIPGGESAREVIARVLAALQDIAVAWSGARVAVVAHGGVLDVAYRAALGLSWDAPRQHLMLNASINTVTVEASPLKLTLVDWGDVRHLSDAADEPVA